MSAPFRLGLTGSIGMGKSTTAAMFAEEGCAVWDADAAVHKLYSRDGAAVPEVARLCPDAISDGAVCRQTLSRWIDREPDALARLEAVVHPLVAADRARFAEEAGSDFVVFDIPLLYETGAESELDAVAVVSAPGELQRARVLQREGMTEARLAAVLRRQIPDAEKRALADFVIPTHDLAVARAAVHDVFTDIRRRHAGSGSRHRNDGA